MLLSRYDEKVLKCFDMFQQKNTERKEKAVTFFPLKPRFYKKHDFFLRLIEILTGQGKKEKIYFFV